MVCVTRTIGKPCELDTECDPVGICDAGRCRVARSCAEILSHVPGSVNGVYTITAGTTMPFSAVCDMTHDGGGWTLLLKASGDPALGYDASAWTDDRLLNPEDLTLQPGNAKYQSFLSLRVTTLRGELDGFVYTQVVPGMTAPQIFAATGGHVDHFPTFKSDDPNWSTQPYCQTFGINTPDERVKTRFGWSANGLSDCSSNGTAIGLGLMNDGTDQRGAGYECLGSDCMPHFVDADGQGLLWGHE